MKIKINNIIKIIFLILTTFFVIFYQFPLIPQYLAFDEVEFTKLALSLENQPYIPYSPLATGHSTLYFYILLFSLKIFGINTFALRFPSAFFGVLSVLIFYLILKQTKQKFINLTLFLFITSRWFFGFSRFSFEVTFLLFLELTSIYFIIRTVLFKKELFLILSGIFAGLAFNSYTPGRIFFILPLIIIYMSFMSFLRKQESRISITKYILYFLIPFIIIITPLTTYLLNNKDTRVDQLFFWKNHEMTINEKVQGTIQNINSIFLMHFWKGDMNGKHNYPGKPALNPVLSILFFTGLFFSIKELLKNQKIENKVYYLLFTIYYLISILPSLAIYPWENPNMLRTYTVLPSIFFFINIAINKIYEKLKTKKLLTIYHLISIILILSSIYEIRTYFKYQSSVFKQAFEIKYPLEKAIKINYEKN